MTDIEKLKALLDDWGIIYQVTEIDDSLQAIVVEARGGPKQHGYGDFFTEVRFSPGGGFHDLGIWE